MATPAILTAVNQTPAHELVVDQLQRAILLGRFLPGDKLPSERAMAEQFGVSRTSVREAIHVLVEYGLLKIKRGATGGAIVQDLIDDSNRIRMRPFAQARRKNYMEMLEFRLIVECAAARMAAQRRSKADLRALKALVDNMDELFEVARTSEDVKLAVRFYAEDTAFHIAIGKASGNQLLHDSVEELRYKMFLPLGRVVAEIDEHANDKHHEIYNAIESGNGDLAAAVMGAHIQDSFDSFFN